MSLPGCQGHTQTPAPPRTPQGSACSVLSSPRVPDGLQGRSPRRLQRLGSRTRLHLGTPWEPRSPEVYRSPAKPPAKDERASLGGGVFHFQSQPPSNKPGRLTDRPARPLPRWGSLGTAGTQAARGPLVTRAQLLPRSALVSRGLQTERGRRGREPCRDSSPA